MHDVADWQFPPAQVERGKPVPDPPRTYLALSKKRKESFKLFPRSETKALNNDSLEKANAIYREKTKENKGNHKCRTFRQIARDKIEEIRCDFSRRKTALNLL